MSAQGSKLWDEKPIAGAPPTAASAVQQITIMQMYVLVWKIAIASFLFALPFLLIWYLANLK
ncbi:MAG TPA: hypothetical protein VGQ12_07340 [Candidatus Angelobacter sp.]|jgi:hypothetical protein|nr:hypothetical protein [Candidatus Angelobacter sp.]